ncbi:MAG: MerR family transcriptional regulator [Archangiaceae bacterium]|nr:MerR family transcriptional regulator [Archangiaceae bacterium]
MPHSIAAIECGSRCKAVPFKQRRERAEHLEILRPEELARIERDYATGLPARVILEIFRPHGVRLSEATFRKYVQAGLLPRSRRVGRKGKHRGSTGLYPVDSVRRINAIKKMMAQGLTLEEIRRSFVFFKNQIDQVERELDEVFAGFETELSGKQFGSRHKRALVSELSQLRHRAEALVRAVSRFGSAVTARVNDDITQQKTRAVS